MLSQVNHGAAHLQQHGSDDRRMVRRANTEAASQGSAEIGWPMSAWTRNTHLKANQATATIVT